MISDQTAVWPAHLTPAVCDGCGARFLLPATDAAPERCPACGAGALGAVGAETADPPPTPELVAPFAVTAEQLAAGLRDFTRRFPFAPDDAGVSQLQSRLRAVYAPMWLVDCDVDWRWQAEVGFDYEVMSHLERFRDGRWQTEAQQETRVRWEPRLGAAQRRYDNVRAPALEEHNRVIAPLGKLYIWETERATADNLAGAAIWLPDRPTADAWNDALPSVIQLVEADCQTAAGAAHIRQFKWQGEFPGRNWTQLLLPVYTTFYHNDAGRPVRVVLHGRTGQVYGPRLASLRAAQRLAGLLGIVAAVVFLVALAALFTAAADYTGPLVFAAVLLGLAALLPLAYVGRHNARESALYADPKL